MRFIKIYIYIYIYIYMHFSGGASSSRVSALPEKCEIVKPFMQTNDVRLPPDTLAGASQ